MGTTFNLSDVPDVVWVEWRETVPRRRTLEDAIVLLLIDETLDKRADLDDETRAAIIDQREAILDE